MYRLLQGNNFVIFCIQIGWVIFWSYGKYWILILGYFKEYKDHVERAAVNRVLGLLGYKKIREKKIFLAVTIYEIQPWINHRSRIECALYRCPKSLKSVTGPRI